MRTIACTAASCYVLGVVLGTIVCGLSWAKTSGENTYRLRNR